MSRSIDRVGASRALLAAAVSALGVFAGQSHAATLLWDNGGADNIWDTAANWSSNSLPQAGDTAVFVGASGFASGTQFTVNNPQTALGISIGNANTTNGYVPSFGIIGPGLLTFKGRVLGVDTTNTPVTMLGPNGNTDGATIIQVKSQTLTNPPMGVGVGTYSISNNIDISVNGTGADPNIAMQSGNATLNLTGVLNTPAGQRTGLRIWGGGTVAITNANNTIRGPITISNGTVIARASDSAVANVPGVFGVSTNALSLGETGVTISTQSVSLLASDSAVIARNINVSSTPSTGAATIGGAAAGTSPATFSGTITLAKALTLRSNGNDANTIEVSGQITGTGNITKTQPGTIRLSNTANNYVGTTTIAAGTLQLGTLEVLPNASELIFSGGTLDTEGLNETAGALRLTANSNIDFSSGGILSLAGPSSTAWTASTVLSLLQWNGLTSGGGITQFFVGSSATLSPSQLAAIDFVDPVGFAPGTYDALQLPSGEVVPVPEPTSLALLATLAAPVMCRRRRASQR